MASKEPLSYSAPVCPYCHKPCRLSTGKEINPNRPSLADTHFWLCDDCGAYVGCHAGSIKPLGTPADAYTRRARQTLHRQLDRLWQNAPSEDVYDHLAPHLRQTLELDIARRARDRIYSWLAGQMKLTRHLTHAGLFDADQCEIATGLLANIDYLTIRKWAQNVQTREKGSYRIAELERSIVRSSNFKLEGRRISFTGLKLSTDLTNELPSYASAWMNDNRIMSVIVRIDTNLDGVFANAAFETGVPYDVILVSKDQKTMGALKDVEKIVTRARDILIVPESIRTHDKVRVMNTMMAERIEALVVLDNQHVDSLTWICIQKRLPIVRFNTGSR